MQMCRKDGCGVCIRCNHIPTTYDGDIICRKDAEIALDILDCLLSEASITEEQQNILSDFEEDLNNIRSRTNRFGINR